MKSPSTLMQHSPPDTRSLYAVAKYLSETVAASILRRRWKTRRVWMLTTQTINPLGSCSPGLFDIRLNQLP
jgi:hypothetical protein